MAQKFKFGNGTWATKKKKNLAYNDENENYKPLPFDFTRASIATKVNKAGLIETVGNDEPRIDHYDTSNGVLLLETGGSNRVPWSEAIDNNAWTKLGVTVEANKIISPDGKQTADLITETTANTQHRIADIVTLSTGVDYTISAFVKPNGSKFVRLRLENASVGSGQIDVYFDMVNLSASFSNGKIQKYSNGWYRISATGIPNNAASVAIVGLSQVQGVPSYTGDGVSGAYVWGVSVEQSSLVTSYIPTIGTAGTRSGETLSNSGNSKALGSTEGVLYTNFASNSNDGTNRVMTISSGSTSQRIQMYLDTNNGITGGVINASPQATLTFSGNTNLYSKVALKYKLNDFALWVNGWKVGVDTTGTVSSSLKVFDYDNGASGSQFYGKVKDQRVYNSALTDAELETLTSYTSWELMVSELNLNIIYNG